ncbi:hypothetical protein RWG68_27860, partial [Pseudomonas aeruginosa]|nr:hypothetical protein [Pseudomonas aeruginosa]
LFEVESTHRLGLASAEEDGRHFARATRALAFFNGLLGAIHNRRSLVSLDNLVDLIITCIEHPAAVGQVFLVSDGEDLSTTELLRRMGRALGAPARLLPVPASWIGAAAKVLNRQAFARRLCGSLQVDIMKTRQVLGWTPPVGVDQALEKTARSFLDRQ